MRDRNWCTLFLKCRDIFRLSTESLLEEPFDRHDDEHGARPIGNGIAIKCAEVCLGIRG